MLASSTTSMLLERYGARDWARHLLLLAMIAIPTASALVTDTRHRDVLKQAVETILPLPSTRLITPEAAQQTEVNLPPAVPAKTATNDVYRVLSEFVAKRYRVSQHVTLDLVSIAHEAAHQFSLDPLLIIAVIAIESRFNPIAESGVGAKGLMQVMPKYHAEKLQEFGGEHAVFDPRTNILVGSKILREYLSRTGNLGIALQMYAGALHDTDDTYTNKVMSEKQRLQQVLSQSRTTAPRAPSAVRRSSPTAPAKLATAGSL